MNKKKGKSGCRLASLEMIFWGIWNTSANLRGCQRGCRGRAFLFPTANLINHRVIARWKPADNTQKCSAPTFQTRFGNWLARCCRTNSIKTERGDHCYVQIFDGKTMIFSCFKDPGRQEILTYLYSSMTWWTIWVQSEGKMLCLCGRYFWQSLAKTVYFLFTVVIMHRRTNQIFNAT